MDLRKEIQVALNSCQPNTNRVDKIEAIAKKYAEYSQALQLQQTGVKQSVCKHEFVSSVAYKGAKICTKCNKYQ